MILKKIKFLSFSILTKQEKELKDHFCKKIFFKIKVALLLKYFNISYVFTCKNLEVIGNKIQF